MLGSDDIIRWLRGYLLVRLKGKKLEHLLNRMIASGFPIWDVEPLSSHEVRLCMEVKDFLRLSPLLKETSSKVRIERKMGLPFQRKRLAGQGGFYGGVILFIFLLYLGSSLIWTVEIEGVSKPEQEALVREILAELGIKPGAFKRNAPPPDQVKRTILEKVEEATWAGFQFEGTKARLEVVLKTLPDPPEPVPIGNLVAKKKAVIRSMLIESGRPQVKLHQLVKPGDILVSGEQGEDKPLTPVKGKVWGEVWYISQITVPLEQKRTVLTGEQVHHYFLQLGPWKIKVWGFGPIPYQQFVRDQSRRDLNLYSLKLPVGVIEEKVLEAKEQKEKLKAEQAVQLGVRMAREKLLAQLDERAEIVDENILKKKLDNGKVYIKMHFSVIEEITQREN